MKVTQRDQALLIKLSSYGILSTKQVGFYFFPTVALTTVLRRLRMLETENYLKRITGLENHELLWTLTEKGAAIGKVSLPKRRWSKNMLEHDYKLLCLRLKLEGAGISESWTPEHKIRSMIFKKYGLRGIKQRLVPDGLMSVDVNGKKESIAIEMELTLKSKRRYRNLFNLYRQNSGIYAVWYVATSMAILKQVKEQWDQNFALGNTKLFCSLFEDVLADPHAQLVSMLGKTKKQFENESTEGNHTPKLEFAS